MEWLSWTALALPCVRKRGREELHWCRMQGLLDLETHTRGLQVSLKVATSGQLPAASYQLPAIIHQQPSAQRLVTGWLLAAGHW